jgi:hypothetical protein
VPIGNAIVLDDLQLKRWRLSFGTEVEVREPAHLRREMAEEMREALRAFDGQVIRKPTRRSVAPRLASNA